MNKPCASRHKLCWVPLLLSASTGLSCVQEHAKALWHHHSGSDSASPDMLQDENSASWSCMGADQPELVPGLTGVKQVVLGGIHGMALVED